MSKVVASSHNYNRMILNQSRCRYNIRLYTKTKKDYAYAFHVNKHVVRVTC